MSNKEIEFNVENIENKNPQSLEPWLIDKYIEIVKKNNDEIKKYEKILKERIADLEHQFKEKKQKLQNENHYLITTLGEFAKYQKDLHETKTQYKYKSLTGDIVIKKSLPKIKAPDNKNLEKVEKLYPEYVKKEEIKKLNWADLKKKIVLQNGIPYDKETGEELSDFIEVEYSEEKIEIK